MTNIQGVGEIAQALKIPAEYVQGPEYQPGSLYIMFFLQNYWE